MLDNLLGIAALWQIQKNALLGDHSHEQHKVLLAIASIRLVLGEEESLAMLAGGHVNNASPRRIMRRFGRHINRIR